MIEIIGQSVVGSAATAGRRAFVSVLNRRVAGGEVQNDRTRTTTRGILINKKYVYANGGPQLDKGYKFQFNPETITDNKSTTYEVRPYTALNYNDYVWSGGGERVLSFELFLDDTWQSKTPTFGVDGLPYGNYDGTTGKAFSKRRFSERGILNDVELVQSFLYPEVLVGEAIPQFASGGIISSNQFRPPAVSILCIGPLYFEGIVKSVGVNYTLFDEDLTPIRGTISVEFAAYEFENLKNMIKQ